MKTTSTALLASLAATAATSTFLLSTPAFCSDAPPARPNIIFILADDLGWGDIGAFYQNARRDAADPARPWHATPSLDRMAAEGARLTDHYVASPVSISSRSSLLTGLTQGHVSIRDNQFDKALPDNHTLATVLRQAGYTTAIIGKWGLHGDEEGRAQGVANRAAAHKAKAAAAKAKDNDAAAQAAQPLPRSKNSDWPAHPLNRGFDYFYGIFRHVDGHEHYPKEQLYFHEKAAARGPLCVWENHTEVTDTLDKCYTTDLYTARAKQFIIDHENKTPAQPFFIYLAYDTPHAVLELPTGPYPAGGGLRGGVQWLGAPGHMINTATGAPDSYIYPQYATATFTRDGKQLPWPNVYQRYATDIHRIDDCVGDLLQLLRDLNIDDNTIVVFTSDNGPSDESYLPERQTPQFFGGFGPFDGIKRDTWEGGLRTPAIARWPGHIPAGSDMTAPCAAWDWLPTFADAAHIAPPAKADGKSLLGNLLGHPAPDSRGDGRPDDYLYFEYYLHGKTPDYPEFEPAHRNRQRDQMQAVREGDIMAIRYDVKNAGDPFEIYNLRADPKEARNLASLTTPAGLAQQAHYKSLALQSRRPEPTAPRPYDNDLMPAIPAPALGNARVSRADETRPESRPAPGLTWSYYEGDFPWTPNCANLSPQKTGDSPDGLALAPIPLRPNQNAAIVFRGYLRVPADGDYVFEATTDTGLIMRLHATTVLDADYGYQRNTARVSGKVRLQAGLHPLTLTYHTDGQTPPALRLLWSAPGMTTPRPLEASQFVH